MQAKGVEKGFVFIYRDVSDNPNYLHNIYLSSGLVTNNGEKDGRKKPAWYYLATLKGVLGSYSFDRIVSDGPNVYHYEYVKAGTNQRAAVLWARNGDRDNGYKSSYTVPAGTLIVPTDGTVAGIASSTDGRLTLTERPVFVLYSSDKSQAPNSSATAAGTSSPTVAPTAPPSLPVESERLTNGGFEDGLEHWNRPSWFSNVVFVNDTQAHEGTRSICFQGKSSGPYIYQDALAAPGEKIQISGWVNVPQRNGSMSVVVELVARHQNGGDLKTIPIATIAGVTDGWVWIGGTAVMPERTVLVRVQVRTPILDGIAYLDGLSLQADKEFDPTLATTVTPAAAISPTATSVMPPAATPTIEQFPTATSQPVATQQPTFTPQPTFTSIVPLGSEALVNGGFESGLDGWYIPAWFASTASAQASAAHSGSYGLRFQGNVAGPYAFQEIPASPGQKATFSGWVNVPERNGDMALVLELVARHQYNGNLSTFTLATFGGKTSGWVNVVGSAVMPERTVAARLQIRFTKLYGTAYLDDLSLELSGNPTPSSTPTPTQPPPTPTPTASLQTFQ